LLNGEFAKQSASGDKFQLAGAAYADDTKLLIFNARPFLPALICTTPQRSEWRFSRSKLRDASHVPSRQF